MKLLSSSGVTRASFEVNAIAMMNEPDDLVICTPVWVTDDGSCPCAFCTRFCTSTAAASTLRDGSKVIVIVETPALEDVDDV